MKFYDRAEQIARLQNMKALSYGDHSRLTVVTGRRRIGKTSLIAEAMGQEPYVYLFVSKKSEAVLCRDFCQEFEEKLGAYIPPVTTFRDVFRLMMNEGTARAYTLVIDEFQNFLEVNPSIFGDIQNFWDQYRERTHINFIVSGSVYSLMETIFKDRKEPLYGRQDATVKLSPFPPSILKEIMADHAPGYSNDDLLALYAFTGAIPKYISLLVDAKALTRSRMIKAICQPDSPFIEEGRRLLIQEFGKRYGTYFSILQAISIGHNTQAEIEDYLGGKSIGGQLVKLEETYDLLRKVRPLWAKDKTQTVRYEISDIFLRFWFRYIEKNQRMVEIGQYPVLQRLLAEDYPTFSGDILERYFRGKLVESQRYRDLGGWWDPKGYTDEKGHHQQCELDIVALTADGKTAEIYEVKRNPDKYRESVLQEKIRHFQTKEKEIRKYKIRTGCLSLEDM